MGLQKFRFKEINREENLGFLVSIRKLGFKFMRYAFIRKKKKAYLRDMVSVRNLMVIREISSVMKLGFL